MNIDNLHNKDPNDTIALEDARRLYERAMKEQLLSTYKFPTKPSSDGYYHIYIEDDTKRSGRRSVKAKTIERLKEKVYSIDRGVPVEKRKRKTFADVFRLVQDDLLKYTKDKQKLESKKNTVTRREQDFNRFIKGTWFESMYIDNITEGDIERICLYNMERFDLKKHAYMNLRTLLSTTFDRAYCDRLTNENVYKRVNFRHPRLVNMIMPDTDIEDRTYTDEEMRRIIDCIHQKQSEEPSYMPAYALEFQILMGARRGEVSPMKWSDINFQKGYIQIQREVVVVKKSKGINDKYYSKIVDHTKTWKDRRVPIWDDMKEFLIKLRVIHDKYYPESDFLFPADNENGCIHATITYKYFDRIREELGIQVDRKLIRGTHAFRRVRASHFIDSGGSYEMASKLFGNTPQVLRRNYYDNLDMNTAREVLNKKTLIG